MQGKFISGEFEDNDEDILSKGFDERSGAEIILICSSSEAIGGEGPIFDHIDKKTVYVLISDKYVTSAMEGAQNERAANVQYGMLIGDIMRRGVYYAQNINKKKRRKNNDE